RGQRGPHVGQGQLLQSALVEKDGVAAGLDQDEADHPERDGKDWRPGTRPVCCGTCVHGRAEYNRRWRSVMKRRDFIRQSAAAALALRLAGSGRSASAEGLAPTPAPTPGASPAVPGAVAISSANGIVSTAKASELLSQGADPLDAAIAGVNL